MSQLLMQINAEIYLGINVSIVICIILVFHLFSKSYIEDRMIPKLLEFGQKHLEVLKLKPFESDLNLYSSMKYKTIQMLNILHYEQQTKPEEFKEYIYKRVSKYAIINIIPMLVMNRIIKSMFKD